MCIIAIKNKGIDCPDIQTLKRCFNVNPHGAGIALALNGKVKIIKGLMTFDSFKKALESIKDKKNLTLVFHFRIGTHGSSGPDMTHPFFVGDHAFCHNGILRKVKLDPILSDTAVYCRDYLSKINLDDKEFTQFFLDSTNEGGRFCALYPDGSFLKSGQWIPDNGVLWSNSGYEDFLGINASDPRLWDAEKDHVLKKLKKGRKVYDLSGNQYQGGEDKEYDYYIDYDSGLWVKFKESDEEEFIDYVTDIMGESVNE